MAGVRWSGTARLLFLAIVVAWGFNYLFVNVGLGAASPLWLATLRASVGALGVLAIVTPMGAWGTLDGAGRRDALLLGLPSTGLFFGLWFVAAESVLPGEAAVLIYTFPFWVALLSDPLLGHRLGARHVVSIGVGFVGIALIAQVWAVFGASTTLAPVLELLGAAGAWAVGTVVFQRRFRPGQMAEANAFQLIGGAAGLIVATALLAPTPLPRFTPSLVASVAWLGILGTAVAYAIWSMLLGRVRAATLSAYVFLVPVVALGASALFFHERLTAIQLAGVGLVLASLYGVGTGPDAASPIAPAGAGPSGTPGELGRAGSDEPPPGGSN
ncbi:MAG TPA: EamA family transporter [Thermoplasmata archaeon]|nr:EamA family transporter [Thermoplasmata archaeon]